MAHELDFSNNRANVAYVGDTPWHGLGQSLTPNQPIEVWTREAGFDWDVRSAPAHFAATTEDGETTPFMRVPRRNVLYRSDTGEPLSVVSDNYRITQPREVMEFFRELTEAGGFRMETAGMLRGGAVYWALAAVDDSFDCGGVGDTVLPYLLLATSCDGTLANTATFTTVRVVCANTLAPAAATESAIRVPHSTHFNPTAVKTRLGVVGGSWERFKAGAAEMRRYEMHREDVIRYFLNVMYPRAEDEEIEKRLNLDTVAPNLTQLLQIYEGGVGAAEAGRANMWRALNAVTRMVDHERRAQSGETRLQSAWFGSGRAMKQRAWSLALEAVGQ